MEEYKFEGIYKTKYCLKVFLNYCALKFTCRLVMRTRLLHYRNARSSFFQSQFVSDFPSTVKLLPVNHCVNFRIFEARSLNSWGNTEISNAVSVSRLAFQCATLGIQLHERGFFSRLKRTILSFFVHNKSCVCRSRQE